LPLLVKSGNVMTRQFPPDHLDELESAAKHSDWPRDMLIFANTFPDLKKLISCSALIVSPRAPPEALCLAGTSTCLRCSPFAITRSSRSTARQGNGRSPSLRTPVPSAVTRA
jgi:hypothetical protein